MDSVFSVNDEVSSLLKVLDIVCCWFDPHFRKPMSFPIVFWPRDIQIMYHQLKQTETLLIYSTDAYMLSCSLKIAEIAREARDYIVSKVMKVLRKRDKKATSPTALSNIIHVLETILRISNKEEHFVLYDEVVSLLHDLELILSSHGHTCYSKKQFRIVDIQIMYDNLSTMDSLLIDSSGQGYDKKLMTSLEPWVGLVAYEGRVYIDLWPQSLMVKKSTGSFLPQLTPRMEYILDDKLRELTQRMEYINRELIGLTGKQPTGSFPPSSENIFELQGTSSAGYGRPD